MVKLVHMSDTHLGYRAGRGTISHQWAKRNYSRPYEQEIYNAFQNLMKDVSNIKNLDFVIHCGDFFHIPHASNPYPPPEPARRVLKEGLNLFFKNTNNNVPFIYIEGNHGILRTYDYTPFETHINKKDFPELYYFKKRDLLDAIKQGKPLKLEFNAKKSRFYLFPYFEFKVHPEYEKAYINWLNIQKPDTADHYINIAVVHGSKIDNTLHSKISSDLGYDYIALGHEHGLNQVSKNCYFSGSLLPLNFKEIYEKQGYLIVNIDQHTKELNVEEKNTGEWLGRAFENVVIEISPQMTSPAILREVKNELDKYISETGFNSQTAARLKFNFVGELTYETTWNISNIMTNVRRECFSQTDKYNILQLIWKTSDVSELKERPSRPGIIEDYILENPDEEFRMFVEEILTDEESDFDVGKLTEFGMSAIKKALRIIKRKKEE